MTQAVEHISVPGKVERCLATCIINLPRNYHLTSVCILEMLLYLYNLVRSITGNMINSGIIHKYQCRLLSINHA